MNKDEIFGILLTAVICFTLVLFVAIDCYKDLSMADKGFVYSNVTKDYSYAKKEMP